uniref:Band_7_C domain-containing protein n=1 Tax=Haemonchus placei TaxID=6290 RepID=A0A0N4WR83_HAEPC
MTKNLEKITEYIILTMKGDAQADREQKAEETVNRGFVKAVQFVKLEFGSFLLDDRSVNQLERFLSPLPLTSNVNLPRMLKESSS